MFKTKKGKNFFRNSSVIQNEIKKKKKEENNKKTKQEREEKEKKKVKFSCVFIRYSTHEQTSVGGKKELEMMGSEISGCANIPSLDQSREYFVLS